MEAYGHGPRKKHFAFGCPRGQMGVVFLEKPLGVGFKGRSQGNPVSKRSTQNHFARELVDPWLSFEAYGHGSLKIILYFSGEASNKNPGGIVASLTPKKQTGL